MIRHFIGIDDLSVSDIESIFKLTKQLKREIKSGKTRNVFKGKTLAMIFEKPSLRTRVSFETGMTQLGGHAIFLGPADIQMGKRETPYDIARNLERMADLIMARVFEHQKLIELKQNTTVPVINALSDLEHPCQALADVFTILEHKKKLTGLKIAFVGDGNNNVTHSLALLASKLGMKFNCASPKGYEMDGMVVEKVKTNLLLTSNPKEAVVGADVVVTDTWVSMGDESEKEKRLKSFKKYQVNKQLFSLANKGAIFMHCLPAYRGYEVTSDVIDSSQSVVYDEAENRLHVQKALMVYLVKKSKGKTKGKTHK